MKAPSRLRAGLVLAATLAGCADFSFGGSVVGGDARVDLAPPRDVPDLDLDPVDAPDVPDVPDAADVPEGGCTSHAACAEPTPRCDTATGRCGRCAPDDDTCPRGQFCSRATLTCTDGCASDDDCAAHGDDGGVTVQRYCDVGRRVCVQCRRDAECPGGQFCAGGVCTTSCSPSTACPAGRACCGGACVDTAANTAHCGACGASCRLPNAAAVCRDGRCAVGTCIDPWGDCDGNAANGCETDLRTTAHCGACGRACPVRAGSAPTCDGRACGARCLQGFADCNGRPDDGCEADLTTSTLHCGGCARECRLANAIATCGDGRCAVVSCTPGFGDCDGVAANGCEVDTRASASHCGACGRACAQRPGAAVTCDDGACRAACSPGLADCNGRPDDGCEVDTRRELLHCGACGAFCRPPHATGQCLSGACEVAACDAGWLDCDARPDNGCETDLATSPRNCGACGRACAAGQVCAAGACVVDCGALARCGAVCADLATDVAHCGRCGNACGASQRCVAGACVTTCRAPETLCAGACVVTDTSVAHCGRCGNACPARPNATPRCAAGACGVACNAGFGDCNANAADGCETNVATDTRHCGACGAACAPANATASCAAGRCGVARCNDGFGDCNANAADGCEVNLTSDARHCGRCGAPCAGVCRAGVCVPAVTIDRPTVVNTVASPASGAAGSRTVTLVDPVGASFPVGSRVLLHQTQGTASTAGTWELRAVTASTANTLTLDVALASTYTTSGASRAQVVLVATYNDLVVTPAGQLTAPEWNGRTGGLLAVVATGEVTIDGAVTMNGRGFRAASRMCPAAGGRYTCRAGAQGESWGALGTAGTAANGGGGGGGAQGEDCAAGGGGAHAPGATTGSNGDCGGGTTGFCAPVCPNPGGAAGAAYGVASLARVASLGSAGGEGGADEDGGLPGGGGNGGGFVFLRAGGALTVNGQVSANGVDGLNGNQFACGGDGCGMGGGGGGAGGSVRLIAARATLGAGRVTATGGTGGQCSCRILDIRRAAPAGRGGNGRVGVSAPTVTGTTTPTFDPT